MSLRFKKKLELKWEERNRKSQKDKKVQKNKNRMIDTSKRKNTQFTNEEKYQSKVFPNW